MCENTIWINSFFLYNHNYYLGVIESCHLFFPSQSKSCDILYTAVVKMYHFLPLPFLMTPAHPQKPRISLIHSQSFQVLQLSTSTHSPSSTYTNSSSYSSSTSNHSTHPPSPSSTHNHSTSANPSISIHPLPLPRIPARPSHPLPFMPP